MAVSKGTVALLHPPPHFCTRWPASHLEVSVSLWMKCQIKCDVKCFYYNPKSQYCTMLHVLIIDSLHIINNNTKMIQRSVSEDPVKMNESFLFSLATSAEPMQVTWKNDLKICIRQMNESFTSRPCLRVNVSFICQPSLRVNLSFIVHRSFFTWPA